MPAAHCTKRLTKSLIQKLTFEDIPGNSTQRIVYDDKTPGLGVRVYPSGAKSYVLQYVRGRRKRLMVLGKVDAYPNLDSARDDALDQLEALRKGRDPLEERRAHRASYTVAQLVDIYVAEHVSQKKDRASSSIVNTSYGYYPRKQEWRRV